MQISIRSCTAALALTALLTVVGTRVAGGADPEPMGLESVTYFNGSTWVAMKTTTGTYEGPAGGASPTARMKSELGGPRTYFILANATSDLVLNSPRPRFRFSAGAITAGRVQLAQFETLDQVRRTPIEINKATTFKKGADLEVTRVSNGVYEVRPKKSLQPGQYALVTSEMDAVADFAIAESGY